MEAAETDGVLFGGEEGCGSGGAGFGGKGLEVARGVAVVIGKGGAVREGEAGLFETCEELVGAGDAAEGEDGFAGEVGWDLHAAVKTPDGLVEAQGAEGGFEGGVVGRDGDDVGPRGRLQWFAEVAGGEEMVIQVGAAEEEDVEVAVELAVLEAVVEQV